MHGSYLFSRYLIFLEIKLTMSNKNKFKYKAFVSKRKHSYRLEPGVAGFLCTCNSKLRERDCVRESYNVLNEFADKLFGSEEDSKSQEEGVKCKQEDDSDEDIGDSLKKEIESMKVEINKKPDTRRFQVVESGANGIVFIRTTVPDPVKLAHMIVTSLSQTQKSKHLLRLLPVEITCKAYIDEICSACDPLFDKYFSESEKTFAVIYNHRNNDSIKRDELIEKVADLVCKKNEKNKTDLKHPQLAVLIEVIRSICCIAVVPDFYALKKYNVMELAAQQNIEAINNEEKSEMAEKCVEKTQD